MFTRFPCLALTGAGAINATGNELDNILVGNTGANRLIGGVGNDTFHFATGFGKEVITDFQSGLGAWDVIYFNRGDAFDNYAEVMAAATQVGPNTVITVDAANTITLTNVPKTALVADDFLFV